jgi:hypothetical protein
MVLAVTRTGLLVILLATAARAQDSPTMNPPAPGASPSLPVRQQGIRDRVRQLESRMAMLIRLLDESAPDQATRLGAAIDWSGQQQLKRRLDHVVELLEAQRLSDAERAQEALLADLAQMLRRLTDTTTDYDRKRERRKRLDAFKQVIRALLDEQRRVLYGTQAAQTQPDATDRAELRALERQQRELQRNTGDLAADMHATGDESVETPGSRQIGNAGGNMQRAAERLAQARPADANPLQAAALEQLQRALDELDDALRQVRREELAETLTALEARFRQMLAREQQVRADVLVLGTRPVDEWPRADHLRLLDTTQAQQAVAEDCQAVVRILLDEGTAVVVPELAAQLAADMAAVAARLADADVSAPTVAALDQIIQTLEEITAAIEGQRRQEQEDLLRPAGGGPQADMRSLLRPSAELSLLRSSQLRINERTAELAAADSGDGVPQTLQDLAQRQQRLAELAQRMHERR